MHLLLRVENDANLSYTSVCDAMKVRNTGCVYSNGIVHQGNNNVDGNSSAVDNKVEKSVKFSSLNLDSPFNVDGFRS